MQNQSDVWGNSDDKGITLGRWISRILSPCVCYNPSKRLLQNAKYARASTGNVEDGIVQKKIEAPVLDQAWAHFEHQTLPRRFKDEDGSILRAPPGERDRETRLYPIWDTTMAELGDFGDGVGLYFYTLRYFGVASLIVGLANIPIIMYFVSNEYTGGNVQDLTQFPRMISTLSAWLLKGSAICHQTSWQPCPTCTPGDWTTFPSTNDRFAYTYTNTTSCASTDWDKYSPERSPLTFIKKNSCELHGFFGIVSFASVCLLMIAIYYFTFTHNKKAIEFDEAKQTTSDYSIVIMNPPKDATKPELWKDFFESRFKNTHITACTIVLNNKSLVKTLVRRRKLLLQLQDMLPAEELYDEHDLENNARKCSPAPCWKKLFCFASDAKVIVNAIYKEDELIQKLSQKKYNVSKVFVTFETQYSQRQVLRELSVTKGDKLRFEGITLKVSRPTEPCDIRWDDLSDSRIAQFARRFVTVVISFALLAAASLFVIYVRGKSILLAPVAITLLNILSPAIVSVLTSFESHPSETSNTTSRYLKLTMFRWMFTAVLTIFVTPFTETLQDGESLIFAISIQFFLDLVRLPLLQLLNIVGNLKRHVLGPRAKNQRHMNAYFQGDNFDIGERYTEVTRILFLACFYGTIYPVAFFFTYMILTMMYCLDKYSILRTWKQGPKIGSYISTFSTNFFLLIALAYTFMASNYYINFPFDNACEMGESVAPSNYIGTHCAQIDNMDVERFNISITSDDITHTFCNQKFSRRSFLPLRYYQSEGDTYVTDSQESFSTFYRWVCVTVLLLVIVTLFFKAAINFVVALFCERCQPSAEVMNDTFSDIPERVGYVPNVNVLGYNFPFLICNIDNIDESLVGWCDPKKSYDRNNMIFDVPAVASAVIINREKKRELKRKPKSRPKVKSIHHNHHVKCTAENVEISLGTRPLENEPLENEKVINEPKVFINEPKTFSIVKEWAPVRKLNLITI